jgi:hypothetical protein
MPVITHAKVTTIPDDLADDPEVVSPADWNDDHVIVTADDESGFRQIISADTTIYVRTDGDDANDGSADDAAHAFLTIQGAVNHVMQRIIINSVNFTIQVGAGTYEENLILGPFLGSAKGTFFSVLDGVKINGGAGRIIKPQALPSVYFAPVLALGGHWRISGFEIDLSDVTSTSTFGVCAAYYGATLEVSSIEISADPVDYVFTALYGSILQYAGGDLTINSTIGTLAYAYTRSVVQIFGHVFFDVDPEFTTSGLGVAFSYSDCVVETFPIIHGSWTIGAPSYCGPNSSISLGGFVTGTDDLFIESGSGDASANGFAHLFSMTTRTASNMPEDSYAVIKNTSTGDCELVVNDGGVIKTVTIT